MKRTIDLPLCKLQIENSPSLGCGYRFPFDNIKNTVLCDQPIKPQAPVCPYVLVLHVTYEDGLMDPNAPEIKEPSGFIPFPMEQFPKEKKV